MRETPLPSSTKSNTFEFETKSPARSSSECTGSLSAFAAALSAGNWCTHVGGFFRTAINSSFSFVSSVRVFATKQKLNKCLLEKAACFTNREGLLAEAAEGTITALYCAARDCEKDEDASHDFSSRAETKGADCRTCNGADVSANNQQVRPPATASDLAVFVCVNYKRTVLQG